MRSWWRRLRQKLPWGPKSPTAWGDRSPKILGVCQECGAVVLEGWHRQVESGYVCQRCAGKKGNPAV